MLVAACGLPKHLLTLWVGGQRLSYEECFSKDCTNSEQFVSETSISSFRTTVACSNRTRRSAVIDKANGLPIRVAVTTLNARRHSSTNVTVASTLQPQARLTTPKAVIVIPIVRVVVKLKNDNAEY